MCEVYLRLPVTFLKLITLQLVVMILILFDGVCVFVVNNEYI